MIVGNAILIDGSGILKLRLMSSSGIDRENVGSFSVGSLILIDGSGIRIEMLIPSSGIDKEKVGSLSVGSLMLIVGRRIAKGKRNLHSVKRKPQARC